MPRQGSWPLNQTPATVKIRIKCRNGEYCICRRVTKRKWETLKCFLFEESAIDYLREQLKISFEIEMAALSKIFLVE